MPRRCAGKSSPLSSGCSRRRQCPVGSGGPRGRRPRVVRVGGAVRPAGAARAQHRFLGARRRCLAASMSSAVLGCCLPAAQEGAELKPAASARWYLRSCGPTRPDPAALPVQVTWWGLAASPPVAGPWRGAADRRRGGWARFAACCCCCRCCWCAAGRRTGVRGGNGGVELGWAGLPGVAMMPPRPGRPRLWQGTRTGSWGARPPRPAAPGTERLRVVSPPGPPALVQRVPPVLRSVSWWPGAAVPSGAEAEACRGVRVSLPGAALAACAGRSGSSGERTALARRSSGQRRVERVSPASGRVFRWERARGAGSCARLGPFYISFLSPGHRRAWPGEHTGSVWVLLTLASFLEPA